MNTLTLPASELFRQSRDKFLTDLKVLSFGDGYSRAIALVNEFERLAPPFTEFASYRANFGRMISSKKEADKLAGFYAGQRLLLLDAESIFRWYTGPR